MICDCGNAITEIVSVEHIKWKAESVEIKPREYSALTFRIGGTATIKVDSKTYFLNSNDILYMPQGVAYTADYSDTEILIIHFKTLKNDTSPEVYSLANTEKIYQAFLSANTLWKGKESGFEAYVMSQIYYILGKLCKNEMATIMPEYFINAVSFINSNYTNNSLSTEKICKTAGVSATNLRLLFKKYYQKTPTQYITNLRLEFARGLISCGTPIEEAAEQSGFNDSKYFARVVKKVFNCTPRELKLYGK